MFPYNREATPSSGSETSGSALGFPWATSQTYAYAYSEARQVLWVAGKQEPLRPSRAAVSTSGKFGTLAEPGHISLSTAFRLHNQSAQRMRVRVPIPLTIRESGLPSPAKILVG